MLAAAVGVTERIQLGVGVMVLAWGDPAWAAKQIASLQHVSGGRVVLGTIGDDWHAQWKLIAQAATLLD